MEDTVADFCAIPVKEKKYIPGRGAVNIPDVKFMAIPDVKFMAFPTFSRASSKGIVPILSSKVFFCTHDVQPYKYCPLS
jgi:hypothetical protein